MSASGAEITPVTATSNQKILDSMPVDPSLLERANWWFDVSWYGLLIAGLVAAFGACATIAFLFAQFWSSGIRDKQSEWRTSTLELQTASAKKDTASAVERIAGLTANAEASRATIAAADARSAEAQQKANEADLARIKLELQLAPRRIPPEKEQEFIDAISPYKGTSVHF